VAPGVPVSWRIEPYTSLLASCKVHCPLPSSQRRRAATSLPLALETSQHLTRREGKSNALSADYVANRTPRLHRCDSWTLNRQSWATFAPDLYARACRRVRAHNPRLRPRDGHHARRGTLLDFSSTRSRYVCAVWPQARVQNAHCQKILVASQLESNRRNRTCRNQAAARPIETTSRTNASPHRESLIYHLRYRLYTLHVVHTMS